MRWVARRDSGITKGAAGDPAELSGSFDVAYADLPGNAAHFAMPAPWQSNKERGAKYKNRQAPQGGGVSVTIVKPDRLAKVVARTLGDGSAVLDLVDGGAPSASGGITTMLTVVNATDGTMHRMCTRFATDLGSMVKFTAIAEGTGRKIVAKRGVPTTCP